MSLSVVPITDSTVDLFGVDCTDLQDNIVIGSDNTISGTLKAVTGYTGFSGDETLQSGNYIALKATANVSGTTITAKLTNTVTLDADGMIVLRIADKSTQKITFVASKSGYNTVTKTFTLTGLTCQV